MWGYCLRCKKEGANPWWWMYSSEEPTDEPDIGATPLDDELCTCNDHDDYCRMCGEKIDDEDYFGAYESRGEYWGAPCSEYVCYGYKCHGCGHKEDF